MAFADPQSITIATFNSGSAISLPRKKDEPLSSTYNDDTENYQLVISHQYVGKPGMLDERRRRTVRVNVRKVASNPLDATVSLYQSASVYLVIDNPVIGFSSTELKDICVGLFNLLTASTNAKLLQFIGGEH
jgi:hypothetical protein